MLIRRKAIDGYKHGGGHTCLVFGLKIIGP